MDLRRLYLSSKRWFQLTALLQFCTIYGVKMLSCRCSSLALLVVFSLVVCVWFNGNCTVLCESLSTKWDLNLIGWQLPELPLATCVGWTLAGLIASGVVKACTERGPHTGKAVIYEDIAKYLYPHPQNTHQRWPAVNPCHLHNKAVCWPCCQWHSSFYLQPIATPHSTTCKSVRPCTSKTTGLSDRCQYDCPCEDDGCTLTVLERRHVTDEQPGLLCEITYGNSTTT